MPDQKSCISHSVDLFRILNSLIVFRWIFSIRALFHPMWHYHRWTDRIYRRLAAQQHQWWITIQWWYTPNHLRSIIRQPMAPIGQLNSNSNINSSNPSPNNNPSITTICQRIQTRWHPVITLCQVNRAWHPLILIQLNWPNDKTSCISSSSSNNNNNHHNSIFNNRDRIHRWTNSNSSFSCTCQWMSLYLMWVSNTCIQLLVTATFRWLRTNSNINFSSSNNNNNNNSSNRWHIDVCETQISLSYLILMSISISLAMMNSYNDFMMPNNNGSPMQPDYHHQYPSNNPLDLPYSSDLFMSPSSNMGQPPGPNRHMNMMQQPAQQQAPPPPPGHPHCQPSMHQVWTERSTYSSSRSHYLNAALTDLSL